MARHFVAVSTNAREVERFGIDPANMFGFWDWVGGRYSYTSAVGLALMLAIGPEAFGDMLAGFHEMDEHFRRAPHRQNLPVLLGLLGVWYNKFFGADRTPSSPTTSTSGVSAPTSSSWTWKATASPLGYDGKPTDYQTGPIIWGQPGTNGQHAFYQLLHQGTKLVPADFIAFSQSLNPLGNHHDLLMANCFAQTEALAFGKTAEEVRAEGVPEWLVPHRAFEGNRPTNTLLGDRLTPHRLGSLVALYEHKVFVQGAIWSVNPFDQWGVELGKVLAQRIARELEQKQPEGLRHDSSTNTLIQRYSKQRG